jgi:hypothetical protein
VAVTRARLCLLIAAAAAAGCKSEGTEVILVTDTDLVVPTEIDTIQVSVRSPDGVMKESAARLGDGEPPLPRFVGLVHREGPLGTFEATVTGRRAATDVVSRRVEFDFVEGRAMFVRVDLLRRCVLVECPTGQTCGESSCRPIAAGNDLMDWSGPPDPLDVPPCTQPESCNGLDDDCDGPIDEGFDLMTDVMNCGGCGRVCALDHATGGCVAGACTIESCESGFDNCDMRPENGCESSLMSPTSCGSCTTMCGPPDRDCCGEAPTQMCGRCS